MRRHLAESLIITYFCGLLRCAQAAFPDTYGPYDLIKTGLEENDFNWPYPEVQMMDFKTRPRRGTQITIRTPGIDGCPVGTKLNVAPMEEVTLQPAFKAFLKLETPYIIKAAAYEAFVYPETAEKNSDNRASAKFCRHGGHLYFDECPNDNCTLVGAYGRFRSPYGIQGYGGKEKWLPRWTRIFKDAKRLWPYNKDHYQGVKRFIWITAEEEPLRPRYGAFCFLHHSADDEDAAGNVDVNLTVKDVCFHLLASDKLRLRDPASSTTAAKMLAVALSLLTACICTCRRYEQSCKDRHALGEPMFEIQSDAFSGSRTDGGDSAMGSMLSKFTTMVGSPMNRQTSAARRKSKDDSNPPPPYFGAMGSIAPPRPAGGDVAIEMVNVTTKGGINAF